MTFKWTPGYTQSGYYTKIHFEASDGSLTASQDINITVRDLNRAPDVSGAYSCPGKLWPATLLRYPIDVKGITDPDGYPVEIRVTSITADEPTTIIGVGSNCIPDATGVGTGCPTLRAEFGVLGNGRVYCVTFAARDGEGGVSVGAVKVSVLVSACIPAVDDGPQYDATNGQPFNNRQPLIVSDPITTVAVGAQYTYNISASDEDGDALVYELTSTIGGNR